MHCVFVELIFPKKKIMEFWLVEEERQNKKANCYFKFKFWGKLIAEAVLRQ